MTQGSFIAQLKYVSNYDRKPLQGTPIQALIECRSAANCGTPSGQCKSACGASHINDIAR